MEHFTALVELSTNNYLVYFIKYRQMFKLTYVKSEFELLYTVSLTARFFFVKLAAQSSPTNFV